MASGSLPKDRMPICLHSSMRDRHGVFSTLTGPNVDQRERVCSEISSASDILNKNRPGLRKEEAKGKDAAITSLMNCTLDFDEHSVEEKEDDKLKQKSKMQT